MDPSTEHPKHSNIPKRKSIAVLPFVNWSTDPDNEYFSDGITEEIINALTRIPGLKVIARTSSFAFKNQNIDVRTIAQKLGVTTILEGSVRRVNNRVRITSQLINPEDGSHLWSKNFDRELEDIFRLQDEISALIADQIRENFGHFDIPTLTPATPTSKIEAYDFWLKGSYHLKRKGFEDMKKALQFFIKASQLDPTYADAQAALGEAYIHAAGFGILDNQEAHRLARKAATSAIQYNAEHAQGHKVLAFIKLFFDWEWEAALSEYELAIANGLPHQNEFASYYAIFIEEDFERAIAIAQQVIITDPLHVIPYWQLGLVYYFTRRFEEAIHAFSQALEIDPNFGEALRFRGLVRGYLGKFTEALSDINRTLELTSGQGLANIDLLIVKILMGKVEEVATVLNTKTYQDSSDPALLYALLNNPDKALFWLEKAYEERSVMLVTLKNFWVWDNLRSDARFQKIYTQMNFPKSTLRENTLQPVSAFQAVQPNNNLLSLKEIQQSTQNLDQVITKQKIFLDPALSLRQLAEAIDLHPNKLSWLLNEHIGKNFNEYINAYRLEVFKKKALDQKNSHLTLLGLAYESGFNSKTVFNSFFKKMEGLTPRAWVKSQR
ncbi:MAG: hypothetical protein Sapg2KO_46680 [Saprospiraceae bacterium]